MTDYARDRFAVQEMTARYARAVDYRELETFDVLFTPDCVVLGVGRDGPIHGVEAWKGWVRDALERFGPTQHLFGNHVIEIRGDEASMRSYLQATHIMRDDPKASLTLWATYYDELVRDGEGWRIREHRLEPAHTELRGGDGD